MKKIAVVIPSYNNCRWYKRNLVSVFAQDYCGNFRVIYIDDGSLDDTDALVREYITEGDSVPLITLTHNPYRVGALQNLYNAISFATTTKS
jgi:glycosyltransferase involved in cell wall biosynthesis